MTEDTKKLLQCVAKNSDIGRSSIKKLIKNCKQNSLSELLHQQYDDCNRLYVSAAALLTADGETPELAPPAGKMMAGAMIAAASIAAPTAENYATMLYNGNLRGIKEISEDMEKHSLADPRAKNLAHCLLDRLEANNRALRKLL